MRKFARKASFARLRLVHLVEKACVQLDLSVLLELQHRNPHHWELAPNAKAPLKKPLACLDIMPQPLSPKRAFPVLRELLANGKECLLQTCVLLVLLGRPRIKTVFLVVHVLRGIGAKTMVCERKESVSSVLQGQFALLNL